MQITRWLQQSYQTLGVKIQFSNLYTTKIFTEPILNGRILSENTLFTVVFVSQLYHMFVNTRQAAGRGVPVSRDQREHSLSKIKFNYDMCLGGVSHLRM